MTAKSDDNLWMLYRASSGDHGYRALVALVGSPDGPSERVLEQCRRERAKLLDEIGSPLKPRGRGQPPKFNSKQLLGWMGFVLLGTRSMRGRSDKLEYTAAGQALKNYAKVAGRKSAYGRSDIEALVNQWKRLDAYEQLELTHAVLARMTDPENS